MEKGKEQMHKQLEIWEKLMQFVTNLYLAIKEFPDDERYGLTNQIRRASVSIPSNIAEGSARQGSKEYVHFLYISLASAAEVETQLLISKNIN